MSGSACGSMADTHQAVVRELTGDERDRAWEHMIKTWPNYARYAERTDRTIPVFFLDRPLTGVLPHELSLPYLATRGK